MDKPKTTQRRRSSLAWYIPLALAIGVAAWGAVEIWIKLLTLD